MCRRKVLNYLFTCVLALINALPGWCQKTISGVVKDSHSEEPIPFASVSFKGTTIGKLTDSSGSFSFRFEIIPTDTIEITCVGYQPYHLILDKNNTDINTTVLMERGT